MAEQFYLETQKSALGRSISHYLFIIDKMKENMQNQRKSELYILTIKN